MIAVIAGSYNQYREFIRENNVDSKEYFYVSSFERILGMRKLKYILYGTWYIRTDLGKIYQRLQIAEFEKIDKPEQEYKEYK